MPDDRHSRVRFSVKTLLLAIGLVAAICATWRVIPYWPPVILGWVSVLVFVHGIVSFRPEVSNADPIATMFLGIVLFILAAIILLVYVFLDFSVGAFIA